MKLTEKIKALNLLPLTPDLVKYICEFDPGWFPFELDIYSYAKFFNGKVYLYSQSYIDSITIDMFNIEFAKQL